MYYVSKYCLDYTFQIK